MKRQILTVCLALVALFLASACAKVVGTGRSQLSLVSDSQLIPAAAQQYRQILSRQKLSNDYAGTNMVRRVGSRIRRAAEQYLSMHNRQGELRNYNWEFNLIDSQEANAFCLPGGKVAVYAGLLPIAQTEAGLATVVGHEVAHAIAHHGAERASQHMMASLGAQILDYGLATRGVSQISGQAIMTAYGLGAQIGVLLPFSRTHESEADRIGLSLMAMAGYEPEEAIGFWRRMALSQNQRNKPAFQFMSTHPADNTRLANLQYFMAEARSYYRPNRYARSAGSEEPRQRIRPRPRSQDQAQPRARAKPKPRANQRDRARESSRAKERERAREKARAIDRAREREEMYRQQLENYE
ncbi:MAG: M48 family metalloprotease [Deltaproteobacteria bacterium]|jgi:predicted Zn-dependent protease|nr:M48 family metalloprotease [Deltaproteobacteria bacterium]